METALSLPCLRCSREVETLYTVPISLPAKEPHWVSLCHDRFLVVLGLEPGPELGTGRVPRTYTGQGQRRYR
jgi:hypothetical protein